MVRPRQERLFRVCVQCDRPAVPGAYYCADHGGIPGRPRHWEPIPADFWYRPDDDAPPAVVPQHEREAS